MLQEMLEALRLLRPPTLKFASDSKYLVGGAGGALDVYSESTTVGAPWYFPGVARRKGGSGRITEVHITLQTTNLTSRLVLFLFIDRPTSNLNDNVANTAPILGDEEIYLDKVDMPAMDDVGTGMSGTVATVSTYGSLPFGFICKPNSDALYGIVASRDALTPTAGDKMLVTLGVEQY